jgi:hypothetical protein
VPGVGDGITERTLPEDAGMTTDTETKSEIDFDLREALKGRR